MHCVIAFASMMLGCRKENIVEIISLNDAFGYPLEGGILYLKNI